MLFIIKTGTEDYTDIVSKYLQKNEEIIKHDQLKEPEFKIIKNIKPSIRH